MHCPHSNPFLLAPDKGRYAVTASPGLKPNRPSRNLNRKDSPESISLELGKSFKAETDRFTPLQFSLSDPRAVLAEIGNTNSFPLNGKARVKAGNVGGAQPDLCLARTSQQIIALAK